MIANNVILADKNDDYLVDKLRNRNAIITITGMNPKSLALAVEWSQHFSVVLYDECEAYIQLLQSGVDPFGELPMSAFTGNLKFTTSKDAITHSDVCVVAGSLNIGDEADMLTMLQKTCRILASYINVGTTIIFESEIKLKWIERICLPILEKLSGLELGSDFNIGFMPSLEQRLRRESLNSHQLFQSHNNVAESIQKLYSFIPSEEERSYGQAAKQFLAKEWPGLAQKMEGNIPGIVMPMYNLKEHLGTNLKTA